MTVHIPLLKIASDIGLSESMLSSWVTHSRPYADGSGYRVFFKVETPGDVRQLLPRITPTNMLIVLAR
ncbi:MULTISPECIES: hypothetical protein [unclassified Pseudomonas]|uniref:hypothetical protein n=1 Tax=unclassified Pseudomonas TaxID=196821 RepID=UPI0009656A41|nr:MULTISPECIES: hypothetical protein [unclassified Pseudomonas]OLU16887.1 hypothetical protein BVH01_09980 [Pseudomonas sp. PA1(2017)]OLU33784.1 hypothetical protein BVH06_07400 [Pseudomonas sp. PA27(2017)]